jgi:hypothetical protein
MVGMLGPQADAGAIGPRLGCLEGTFSPSRRQTRSTRPSLTDQPACRSSAAILR